MDFLIAYFLTISIEAVILFFILRTRYAPLEITKNAIIASSLTLPFVWFLFPTLGLDWFAQTALAEAFAVIVETGIYAALFPCLKRMDAFFASFVCNAVSFGIGLMMG